MEGDLILLTGDFNNYILSYRPCQYFYKLGIIEFISHNHGTDIPGSTRYNKPNKSIDGMWGSCV